jgi:hypothetical protein
MRSNWLVLTNRIGRKKRRGKGNAPVTFGAISEADGELGGEHVVEIALAILFVLEAIL